MLSFNEELIKYLSLAIELAGITAIILGAVWAIILYLSRIGCHARAYEEFRAHLGRGILIGLEFLVAADIIRTVAIEPSWNSVGLLSGIVLIRTFLSMTLAMEINGWLPWERHKKTIEAIHEKK